MVSNPRRSADRWLAGTCRLDGKGEPKQLPAFAHDTSPSSARISGTGTDDAGAGKTITARLLLRELRGLIERVLVVCPANLTFQWQRELNEKFDEKFLCSRAATSAISSYNNELSALRPSGTSA